MAQTVPQNMAQIKQLLALVAGRQWLAAGWQGLPGHVCCLSRLERERQPPRSATWEEVAKGNNIVLRYNLSTRALLVRGCQ